MKTCDTCKKPIPKRHKRFCNMTCYAQWKRDPQGSCERCGKKLHSSQKRFCSRACYNPTQKQRDCEICGQTLLRRQKRFCSKTCYGQWVSENPEERTILQSGGTSWNKGLKGYMAGEKHWNWKGGQRYHSSGYKEVRCPGHPNPNNGGYVLEHRLVMEEHLDRYLTEDEVVHHINGIKWDNKIDNLMLLTRAEHQSMHTKEWWVYVNGLIKADKKKHGQPRPVGKIP